MYTVTHPLGSGVNSSKAMFDFSFFRQPFSLPSWFSRSEIDPADSQGGQEKSPESQSSQSNPSVEYQSVSHVFICVPMIPDF